MNTKRNPILFWLITVLTGGLFGIAWTYMMANDANSIIGEEKIKIRKNIFITISLLIMYGVLFAYNLQLFEKNFEIAQAGGTPEMPGSVFFLNFFLALAMMSHLISVLLRTANIARTKVEIPSSVVLGILMMIYLITLPILQSKLNKISQHPSK